MNIKTTIDKIPPVCELGKRLLAYAKLDYLMNYDEEEYKVYHYDDKDWIENGHFFRIDDTGGDHYHVLISPVGSVVKGFGHESEMSPYNFSDDEVKPALIEHHNFYQDMPPALFKLLDDKALEPELATFCLWQQAGAAQWSYAALAIPADWSDGSADFLNYVFDLEAYTAWFEAYYEAPLDKDVLQQIYDGMEITTAMIELLPTDHDAEMLLNSLPDNF